MTESSGVSQRSHDCLDKLRPNWLDAPPMESLHVETDLSHQRPRNPLFDAGHAHLGLQRFLERLHLQLDLGLEPRNLVLAVNSSSISPSKKRWCGSR